MSSEQLEGELEKIRIRKANLWERQAETLSRKKTNGFKVKHKHRIRKERSKPSTSTSEMTVPSSERVRKHREQMPNL